MVFGKAYARATGGHLQGSIASNTIMTSMVLITAIAPFFQELNCHIYMTQRQLHLTGKYHKCLSALLLQTSQCEYLEYERNQSRLQLKEAARFYNNLFVGIGLGLGLGCGPINTTAKYIWDHMTHPNCEEGLQIVCHFDGQLVGLPTDLVI